MKSYQIIVCFLCVFGSITLAPGQTTNRFGDPQLILEANAGDQDGEFGIITGADISWPNDFVVDPNGAIWIMDIMNRRVQKFTRDGKFLLTFPNKNHRSPIELACLYIECAPDGKIFIGPRRGSIIVLNNEGQFLRKIELPGGKNYGDFNFSINKRGELLYKIKKDILAIGDTGEILYAIPTDASVSGAHSSPYSKYHVSYNRKRAHYAIVNSEMRTVRDDAINKDASGFESVFSSDKYSHIFLVDNAGNLFVKSRLKSGPKRASISYHSPEGRLIQTLKMPPFDSEDRLSTIYTIDKHGNLYVMDVTEPQNAIIKPRTLIKDSTPCVRIWRWKKK